MTHGLNCRVAFVGAGGMIREHLRAFGDVPGVELVGITNRTGLKADSLAAEFALPGVYPTVSDMWIATRADLVVMAVYETAIHSVAQECFKYPWSVFMEKPVGLDYSDARSVASMAQATARRVWVGLNRRALSSTRAVLADLKNDPNTRFIHVQDQQSLETARTIGHLSTVVDNWMFANSIHLVDYLLAFGRGAIQSVTPLLRFNPAKPGVVLALVTFDSGDTGVYEALWHAPGPWACTVTTSRRRWELRPLERASFQNAGERNQNVVEPEACDVTFKPGFRVQAERVVAAWRGENVGAPTLQDALLTTGLVARIYDREDGARF